VKTKKEEREHCKFKQIPDVLYAVMMEASCKKRSAMASKSHEYFIFTAFSLSSQNNNNNNNNNKLEIKRQLVLLSQIEKV
jgi:hypothetical protein